MRKSLRRTGLGLLCGFGFVSSVAVATTINSTNHLAYGANLGWLDWRGDSTNGAVVGEYVCSGYLYSANVGWIHLGDGNPTNGIRYQNLSASDFGVNQDGLGNLRGYAYGANIGWINFESNGAPAVNLKTGHLGGSVWSANGGWISLSNSFAFVQTDTISSGADTDGDGMSDAWERTHFSNLAATAAGDTDSDGMSNKQEYLADTNPNDANDQLLITTYATTAGGTQANVIWKSTPTRCYYIQKSLDLTTPVWFDSGLGLIAPDGTSTTRAFADTPAPGRFYRVRALRPLAP